MSEEKDKSVEAGKSVTAEKALDESTAKNKRSGLLMWLLGLVFLGGLLLAMVTFQVEESQTVILSRWGKPVACIQKPGLNWKLPYPIDKIWSVDNRLRVFNGKGGRLEEVSTADEKQLMVSMYTIWRISNALEFRESIGSVEEFEQQYNNISRSARKTVVGKFSFRDILGKGKQNKLAQLEVAMRNELGTALMGFGVEVVSVGFQHVGLPDAMAAKVLERMKAEKVLETSQLLSAGEREAEKIKEKARTEAAAIIAEAEARAKMIEAKTEAGALEYFKVLASNPKLAAFLKKLEALEKSVDGKTTLILQDNTAPYDLLSDKKKVDEPRKKSRR